MLNREPSALLTLRTCVLTLPECPLRTTFPLDTKSIASCRGSAAWIRSDLRMCLAWLVVRRILPIHHHPLGCVVTSPFGCGRDVLAGARWVWARPGVLGESAPNGRLSVWPETRTTGCCVRAMELEDDAPLLSDYIMHCDTPIHCLMPCALCLGRPVKCGPPPLSSGRQAKEA